MAGSPQSRLLNTPDRCDCKNSFLQSQESGDRDQESVKTKTYGADLFLNYSFPDFLQVHQVSSKSFVSDELKESLTDLLMT